jgi:hypothetical protein
VYPVPVHAWQQKHCAWPKNPEEGTEGEMDFFKKKIAEIFMKETGSC